MKAKKPPIERAKTAGMCYLCGTPIYVGDKIRVIEDKTYNPPIVKARHSNC